MASNVARQDGESSIEICRKTVTSFMQFRVRSFFFHTLKSETGTILQGHHEHGRNVIQTRSPNNVLTCCFSTFVHWPKMCHFEADCLRQQNVTSSNSFVQFSPSLTISQFRTVKPCVAVTFYRPHWSKWLSKDMPKGWKKDKCFICKAAGVNWVSANITTPRVESCMFCWPALKAMTLTALWFRSRPRRSHQTGCAAALLVGYQAV